uniref:Glutaredoxin domain-containing protein n=1 Tax=Oxyrrhis marina TaxID=2969 RepID=A0A7S4LQ21_OXYMA|mmetsp:Transcript_36183/g.88622  ORF Transcript_36183/g.88622 Transcript_36183/m.88622 type:complete len:144 (+) Transcript_36183:52-483(+)
MLSAARCRLITTCRIAPSARLGVSVPIPMRIAASILAQPSRSFCAAVDETQQMIDSADVVVFATSTCPFCRRAISALEQAGIKHQVVKLNALHRKGLLARVGSASVPAVWVKGQYVGGCNDGKEDWHGVLPMLQSGKLQQMLQ